MIRRSSVLPVSALLALTVALMVPVAPAGAAKKPRFRVLYGGNTSQHDPFVLKLAKNAKTVDRASIMAEGTCSDGSPIRFGVTLRFEVDTPAASPGGVHIVAGDRVSRSGSFSASGSGVDGFGTATGAMTHAIKGKVRRNGSAAGTYQATIVLHDDATGAEVATCDTGLVRWTGRSSRGRVYAGATSQGWPMVVEVDKARDNVEDVWFGWDAPCTPSGGVLIGDVVSEFPIRDGKFGDSFPYTVDLDNGEKLTLDYVIDGRLSRAKASGSVSVKLTSRNPAGAVTSTCDSGAVSWSLRST